MKLLPLSALLGALIAGLLSLIFGFWCATSLPVPPAEYGLTFWQYIFGFLIFGLVVGTCLGLAVGHALRCAKKRIQVQARFQRMAKRRQSL